PGRRAVSSKTATASSCGRAAPAKALQPSAWESAAERSRPPSDAGDRGASIPPENGAAASFQRWNVALASSKRNILLLRVLRGLEFPPGVRSFQPHSFRKARPVGRLSPVELSTPGRPY